MSLRVRLTAQAKAQAHAADEWWQRNRCDAPDAFWDELIETLKRLIEAPEIGAPAPRRGMPALRKILLPTSRYHVYYVAMAREIRVRAIWSAVRAKGPTIATTKKRTARKTKTRSPRR